MNAPTPVNLALDADKQLVIEWSDGARRRYTVRELREKCPCATCREKRNAPQQGPQTMNAGVLELLPSGPRPDQVQIEAMSPVGHYAYSVTFSDGHDTGIYPLELLRELGTAI
jgi:DUF971 family protein